MFEFLRGQKAPPAGPDGTVRGTLYPPAGDASTHIGRSIFDRAPSRIMREFDDMEQPPIGVPLTDPRHNFNPPSRFGMSWFGGTFPNQPLPDWSLVAQSNTERFHVPLSDVQVKDRASRAERGKGKLFPTAVVNPPQYMRMGGAVPIGIGPAQVDQFKATTDSFTPAQGNGPGSTWVNPTFMAAGFAAET